MKRKRLLAWILCMVMIFSNAISVAAEETSTGIAVEDSVKTGSREDNAESQKQTGTDDQTKYEEAKQETEQVSEPSADAVQQTGGIKETEQTTVQNNDSENVDASVWNVEDFTYTSYEKRLYGCDYSRDLVIKGSAIAGFSESGLAKLEKNTDLVLPFTDDEGDQVVGVAPSAFYKKGLTSVTFPTGMMVDYNDTVTNGKVTKRGNFVIAENAFAGNKLTSVTLPEGVIACLPNSFMDNEIVSVKFPKTIWWIETQSFARNKITTVNFPTTCDFQLEMHGMPFAKNFIKSVRLPDYTEVVNKDVFAWNTGKEALSADAPKNYKTYTSGGKTYEAGIVYMYADNAEFEVKDRIHHDKKETESQHSWVQRLVINDGSTETENPDLPWNVNDFTFDGQTVTGLSKSGIAKRAANKDLVIPDFNKDGMYVTAIADAQAGGNGLFASAEEGFDSVYLPTGLQKIGNNAFQNNGLKEVTFPSRLSEIGNSAFQTNDLTSVILPDTVTKLGNGAFATNPKLERISLSKGLTEIPDAAFGCSDAKNYMSNLKSITIPEGITKIGKRAFAGNNFAEITLPSSVKEIGDYAFSTKNYLSDSCTLTLNDGLTSIGDNAFRNKVIAEVTLPVTVEKLKKNTFRKEYSDGSAAVVTKVYVSSKEQYEDKVNFPESDYHKLYLTDESVWTAEDFTYAEENYAVYPAEEYSSTENFTAHVITGLSEQGENKLAVNKNLVIPEKDSEGKKIQGIGKAAFKGKGIETLSLPENVKTAWDDSTWNTSGKGVKERGDFFIGYEAFRNNKLKNLELPEGVFFVHTYAFAGNKSLEYVKLPKSLMAVSMGSFAQCAINMLEFPEKTDFAFNIDASAFGLNKIQSVQIPENTEKLNKNAFASNKDADNNKVVVKVYIDTESVGSFVATTSTHHEVILGKIPDAQAPWGTEDFTYDEAGTTITGLSDTGKEKIKNNPNLILPKAGPSGEKITALGNGTGNKGIFVVTDGDKNYTPASVQLPETLEKIGNFTFAIGAGTYEAEMNSIEFPEGLKEIGATAFQNSKLVSVNLPDSVTILGKAAFTGSTNIQSIKLSANLTEIPDNAFANGGTSFSEFGTLVIPEGVTKIGARAFNGRHIKNVVWPKSLEIIGNYAFDNHQMTEIELPENVKSIGTYAFRINQEGLENTLTTLKLNEGLETIGNYAFMGSKIIEVELPSTLKLNEKSFIFGKKGSAADPVVVFKTTDKVKAGEAGTEGSYNFADVNQYSHKVVYDKLTGTGWTSGDFTYDGTTITGWSESGQEKRKTIKTLVLPDQTPDGQDITAVGEAAFKIPDDEVVVTKFGVDSPEGMTSVVLPEKATVIGNEAFAQNALTVVDFTGITSIGYHAFYGNDLVEAMLPDTVTEMGEGAFSANDITKIRLSDGVTKIPAGAFSMNIRLAQVEIPDTVTEIGQTAFAGARLTSLTIPSSVTRIGDKAFHLHHLTELVIPGNVKEIGESAFEGTYKATTLKSLVIEEGVESIGKYAFKEALLETVHFPDSIKTVGEKPFLNNKGKDGSHVVEVTTSNKDHRSLKDDTYVINYTGKIGIDEVKDKVKLAFTKADYTGKEIKPKVTIEGLKEGKDFSVKYQNNVLAGTATVVITGMGQYEGSITENFTIEIPEKVEIVVKPSTPSTKVEDFDKDAITGDVLTEDEKAQVESGTKVHVYLEVERVSESDVAVTDILATNAKVAEQKGFQKGMYLDISMWKAIGNNAAEKVQNAKLGKKVKIAVELPDELLAPKGKVRTYYVVRVHEGVAEILPTTLNGKTITFETDKFSTYSIWYTETDVEKGAPSGGEGEKSQTSLTTTQVSTKSGNTTQNANHAKAAKTGDSNAILLLCALFVVSGLTGSVIYRRKKRQ